MSPRLSQSPSQPLSVNPPVWEHQVETTRPKTILHIDADAFFASVEQGFVPALRHRPVIVGGTEDQRGVVHTASYDARKQGVYTGMPLRQAKKMVPDAVFLKGDFEHYKAVSQIFENIYYQFTPVIEMTSLDDAYLDLTGTLKVHGKTPAELARIIQQKVYRAVGVTVSCGVGSAKFIARIASGVNKPNGITSVAAGTELEFLRPLPVEELPGIGPRARESLHQLGVFTISELAVVPKAVLMQRFGVNGRKFWEFANGTDSREIKQRDLPKQISRETGFEEDVSDQELVFEVLHYLTERIGKKLREDGLVAKTVSIKVEYSDHKRTIKARSLPESTASTDAIFRMVSTLLRETPLRRLRVHRVGLAVSKIDCLNLQAELFTETSRRETIEATMDKIRQRFGFTSIMPASQINLQKHYRMEKSGYVLHAPALTR